MPRKFLVGLLAAAIAAMALFSASIASAASANKVTISSQSGGFSGFVISNNDKCHNGRKVTLYKLKGKKRNYKKDKKIGSDTATPNGDGSQWFIDTPAQGKFYAYVKKNSKCKAAYSKVVRAQPPAEEGEEG